jgi:hypothetical protein
MGKERYALRGSTCWWVQVLWGGSVLFWIEMFGMFCDEGLYRPAICLSHPSKKPFCYLSYKIRKGIDFDDWVKRLKSHRDQLGSSHCGSPCWPHFWRFFSTDTHTVHSRTRSSKFVWIISDFMKWFLINNIQQSTYVTTFLSPLLIHPLSVVPYPSVILAVAELLIQLLLP